MPLRERISNICIKIADWISHPVSIAVFPILCILYIYAGGVEDRLTLILSVLAISTTQMILNAQNIDSEATKLQIAELIRATPKARNVVISDELSLEDMQKLQKEIEDAIAGEIQLAKSRGDFTEIGERGLTGVRDNRNTGSGQQQ